jgi:hypothetical protein
MQSLSILFLLAACSAPAPQSTAPSEPTPTQTVIGSEAQSATPTPPPATGCPSIQIKAPDSVNAGQSAKVTTIAVDGATPTYNWTVSAGTIVGGQGTPVITIDTTGLGGSSVTATVELGNLATECETRTATATVMVAR